MLHLFLPTTHKMPCRIFAGHMDEQQEILQITDDPFAAVKLPEYKNLIIGRFFFIAGLRMLSTLMGWWIYELTNDPFAIGLIGLSEVIPALSMALYSGHIIDISEKRKLLLTGVTLYFIASVLFFCLSSKYSESHF